MLYASVASHEARCVRGYVGVHSLAIATLGATRPHLSARGTAEVIVLADGWMASIWKWAKPSRPVLAMSLSEMW